MGKENSTAKFTASMRMARHVLTRHIVPPILDPDRSELATRLPVLTLGKWKIGPSVLIPVEREFSIEESPVIGLTLTSGSIRNLYRSDAIPPSDHLTCNRATWEIAALFTLGGRQLGKRVPLPNAADRVSRSARWHALIALALEYHGRFVHKNSDLCANDAAMLSLVSNTLKHLFHYLNSYLFLIDIIFFRWLFLL